jgi:hypothetical protein
MASETKKVNDKLSYAQLHDIPRVSITEAKLQLELSILSNQHRGCLVFVGEAGLGKTQIIQQTADKLGYKLVTIHTAQWGPLGCGIPSREAEKQFFKLIVPDIFPKQGEKTILLFDEINRGEKHAIKMLFNLVEDRSMFDYKLPDECIVVGTMNPATNNYSVTPIENEAAIRRRLKFMFIMTNIKDFILHAGCPEFHQYSAVKNAKGKPCHPMILGFFKAEPNNIYNREGLEQNKQFSCPATIETISEDAYLLEDLGYAIHGAEAFFRYSASIGNTMASTLIQFLKDQSTTISAQDVIYKYPTVQKKVEKLSANTKNEHLSELATNVIINWLTDTPEIEKVADNLLKFWTALPLEIVQGMLTQIRTTAEEFNAKQYLTTAMGVLSGYDAWANIHIKMDQASRKMDAALKAGV